MRLLIMLMAGCLAWPHSVGAETVSFEQALREAAGGRPMVQGARQEALAGRARVGEAASRYLPRVVLSESFYATDEPAGSLFISLNQEDLELSQTAGRYNFPPSRKDFETRLSVDQALFDPDISYGYRRACKAAESVEARAGRVAEEAAFEVFSAYLEVQNAAAARLWTGSSLNEAEEIARLAHERYKAGVGLRADWLRAKVRVAGAEQGRISADHDLLLAKRALALAMGRDGGEVDIAAPLTPANLGEPAEPAISRGDLTALALMVSEADLEYRQSRAAYLPRVGVSASYALHDNAAPFGTDAAAWSVRTALSWELFDGMARSHRQVRTEAVRRARQARLTEASRQARFEVEAASLRAREAGYSLKIAEAAVNAAEESLRLLLTRYEAGLSDLSELLSAQQALERARRDRVHSASGELLALGQVRYQSGTFLQSLLAEGGE